LLSAIVYFFEHGRWGSLIKTAVEGQSLVVEDQLFILAQAGLYLTATANQKLRAILLSCSVWAVLHEHLHRLVELLNL